jgi:hypothetical protein
MCTWADETQVEISIDLVPPYKKQNNIYVSVSSHDKNAINGSFDKSPFLFRMFFFVVYADLNDGPGWDGHRPCRVVSRTSIRQLSYPYFLYNKIL